MKDMALINVKVCLPVFKENSKMYKIYKILVEEKSVMPKFEAERYGLQPNFGDSSM